MDRGNLREIGKINVEQVNLLKTNGMIIAYPTPQFRAELDKVGETLIKKWVKEAGAVGEEVFKRFNQ